MSIVDGIIEAPDRLAADVQAILGESSTNLGVLCRSAKINMWSRMKPVHIANTPFPDRSGKWWRGSDRNCGLTMKTSGNYKTVLDYFTEDLTNGWSYIPPKGGAESPFRLADFIKYYKDAIPPLLKFYVTSEAAVGGTISATMLERGISDDKSGAGSVELDDISVSSVTLDKWALGIVVTDSAGNVKGRVFGTTSLARKFTLTKGSFTEGKTYYAYPIFALYEMGQTEADIINTYIPAPNVERASFKVVSAEQAAGWSISISAKYIYNSSHTKIGVHWEVKVSNHGSNGNINRIGIMAMYSSFGEALNIDEPSTSIDSAYVGSGETQEWSGDLYGIDSTKVYTLYVTVNTGYNIFQKSVAIFAENEEDTPAVLP